MRRSLPALQQPVTSATHPIGQAVGSAVGAWIRFAAHAITGVRAVRHVAPVLDTTRVYFANHASHGDIVLIWATLPGRVRRVTRPVAGGDYWNRSALRRFMFRHVFNALPIDPAAAWSATVPLDRMIGALDRGESLVLFPEGTRNNGDAALLPFKCGLFYLGRSRPEVELVPVWIDNAARAMAKGRWIPVPILCTVSYGAALRVESGEDKDAFMHRAMAAVEALRPRDGAAA